MVRPPALVSEDLVGIAAPANQVDPLKIEKAVSSIQGWGLQVIVGESVHQQYHQFAGTDKERLDDFQEMLDNPEIKAIFCARGGYGTTRIIDQLNFDSMVEFPKWIIGFSDVTSLLSQLCRLNYESIHGIMPVLFSDDGANEAVQSLKNLLFGHSIEIEASAHQLNILGQASGPVVGGNLSMLVHLIGSHSDLQTSDAILFIEDVGERLYQIDRMMVQLKRAGKLSHLKGLVVGAFTKITDNDIGFGKKAYEIILEHASPFNYPVAFGFPIGHTPQNMAIPFGRVGILSVANSGARLSF